jgi:hypothetical protein
MLMISAELSTNVRDPQNLCQRKRNTDSNVICMGVIGIMRSFGIIQYNIDELA